MNTLVDRIDALLPQTQCTQCGYAGCRPYAEAIAAGEAGINQCPPGGDAGVRRLAVLLERDYRPLNPANGHEKPRAVARIDEARCIGCTLCIQACPVDAIAGAPRHMHTVIADLCTGCDLCVPPCPVDCIVMLPVAGPNAEWSAEQADDARERFQRRNARLAQEAGDRMARLSEGTPDGKNMDGAAAAQKIKKDILQAVIERARAQRAGTPARTTGNLTHDEEDRVNTVNTGRSNPADVLQSGKY